MRLRWAFYDLFFYLFVFSLWQKRRIEKAQTGRGKEGKEKEEEKKGRLISKRINIWYLESSENHGIMCQQYLQMDDQIKS